MRLVEWRPITGAGALLGRATIRLPGGLIVSDIGIFERADGARWAQMPSEPMRDRDGQPIHDDRGRIKYRSAIKWENRELQDAWSAALLALVDEAAP
jgi:hypothetical protein